MLGQAYIKLATEAVSKYVDLGSYGITLIRGWREALLTPPSIKELVTNDNRLEHGVAVVAAADYIKKDKRDISLPFFLEGNSPADYLSKYEAFLNKIAYSGEFCLKVPCLGKVYKLVYASCTRYGDYGLEKSNFELKLTEYNPNDRENI